MYPIESHWSALAEAYSIASPIMLEAIPLFVLVAGSSTSILQKSKLKRPNALQCTKWLAYSLSCKFYKHLACKHTREKWAHFLQRPDYNGAGASGPGPPAKPPAKEQAAMCGLLAKSKVIQYNLIQFNAF